MEVFRRSFVFWALYLMNKHYSFVFDDYVIRILSIQFFIRVGPGKFESLLTYKDASFWKFSGLQNIKKYWKFRNQILEKTESMNEKIWNSVIIFIRLFKLETSSGY